MENYADAAIRHWKDANLLEDNNAVENADQLLGLAAECAIKSVLEKFPSFINDGRLGVFYKQHINVLWGRVNHQSYHRAYPRLAAFLKTSNDFDDWDVEQRSFSSGHLTNEKLLIHKDAAKRILGASNLLGVKTK